MIVYICIDMFCNKEFNTVCEYKYILLKLDKVMQCFMRLSCILKDCFSLWERDYLVVIPKEYALTLDSQP